MVVRVLSGGFLKRLFSDGEGMGGGVIYIYTYICILFIPGWLAS